METIERAKEIIEKMYVVDKNDKFNETPIQMKQAINCALIAVDEILLFLSLQIGFYDEKAIEYYNQVKKEIINFNNEL